MKSEKINILITTSSFPRWKNDSDGIFIFELAKNLTKYKNLKIFVLAPHYPGAKKKEIIDKIIVYRFKYFIENLEKLSYNGGILANIKKNKIFFILIPFFILSQLFNIKKIIKKEKIDIIHAHWFIFQGMIAVLYKKIFNKKIKIICTAHGTDIFGLQGKISEIIKKYTIKNVDKITTVSQALANEINKNFVALHKTSVIYNSINIKIFKPNINTESIKIKYGIKSFCLLFVGRLIREKGIINLIKAIPIILKKFPDLKLIIIGEGNKLTYLKKIIRELKIQKNVLFLGKIKNNQLPVFYNLADIFINPSYSEGLPTVCLEALACQTMTIATDVGGTKEIIKNNNTGILLSNNKPKTIAQAIINLLKNSNSKKTISKNGFKFIKNNFNKQKISKKYYQEYKQLS